MSDSLITVSVTFSRIRISSLIESVVFQESTLYDGATAPCRLNIVIIGAGISGLCAALCLAKAGHTITVLEGRSDLQEIGAGIQVGPNTSRLLIRWGLKPSLDNAGVLPTHMSFLRYDNGKQLAYYPYQEFGSPCYDIHRRDVVNMLHEATAPLATLRFNTKVASVNPDTTSVTLNTGQVIQADMIIGADGVNSLTRNVVVGSPTHAVRSGDAAFRSVVDVDRMMLDPDLRPFVEKPQLNVWLGPERHLVMYSIGLNECNVVLLHPDETEETAIPWTRPGDIEKMKKEFADWDPRIGKLIDLIPSGIVGSLKVLESPLKSWVHKNGRIALVGDACHPMLPYRAQAASMAIEDAAVLGNLFVRLTSKDQIPTLLEAYESLRNPRAMATADGCWEDKSSLHLPDGPEQRARDEALKVTMAGKRSSVGQDSEAQYDYDVEVIVNDWWKSRG
ncbi:FAD/NAD(P)-binding domain-containing protein [Guyanagaster necrorhizus]|uniref:FAD/NAD(P)-binding domain-containing protein n=1 Tax=Guyanagaster necrorhizus TaxID=856835 RepID=A0A9P7VH16_9AGAR|nr:FAD/NAD(P)-binding domain-containing protein [Guyanagaster necrorhizus MCA 3950]KAG7440432.1 FAD/NAD(P)-binding domain-containing protein [Guyanagaster necrorhizus MCA 3950]